MIPVAQHVRRYGRQIIVPTKAMTLHWFRRLNSEVFGGDLPLPTGISLRPIAGCMATFQASADYTQWWLAIRGQPMSRYAFLECLVHEMVHAAVAFLDQDHLSDHGPAFMAYAAKVATLAGLPLKDRFYGEPEEL
jgi:hypothetical protein